MTSELWLLRHGDAVAHGARASDADRELTPRGERQARVVGEALRRLDVAFTAVYASPKLRALETARLACEAMGGEAPAVYPPLAEGFTASEALTLARAGDGGRILLVGHNPDLPQVVYDVTGAHIAFKKSGIAAIELAQRQLLTLLRPRELEAIAGT